MPGSVPFKRVDFIEMFDRKLGEAFYSFFSLKAGKSEG